MKNMNLNENEKKALAAIVATCDNLDGDLFTRWSDLMNAVIKAFDMNGQVAGGYVKDLLDKGIIEPDEDDDTYGTGVWVNA